VTEPARLQALEAGSLRIQSWKGMAFEVQVSTDLDEGSPLTTVTNRKTQEPCTFRGSCVISKRESGRDYDTG
jgi:hypothetical protein